jgi:hypothetical protein
VPTSGGAPASSQRALACQARRPGASRSCVDVRPPRRSAARPEPEHRQRTPRQRGGRAAVSTNRGTGVEHRPGQDNVPSACPVTSFSTVLKGGLRPPAGCARLASLARARRPTPRRREAWNGSVPYWPGARARPRRASAPTTGLAFDASRRTQLVASPVHLGSSRVRRSRRDPRAFRSVDLPWSVAIEDEDVEFVRHRVTASSGVRRRQEDRSAAGPDGLLLTPSAASADGLVNRAGGSLRTGGRPARTATACSAVVSIAFP